MLETWPGFAFVRSNAIGAHCKNRPPHKSMWSGGCAFLIVLYHYNKPEGRKREVI